MHERLACRLRWLFNALIASSLILLAFTLMVWAQSYWFAEQLIWQQPPSAGGLIVCRGEFCWFHAEEFTGHFPGTAGFHFYAVGVDGETLSPGGLERRWDGVILSKKEGGDHGIYWYIAKGPMSVVAAVFLLPTLPRLRRMILRWQDTHRRYREARLLRQKTHCSTCGYDLRATPDRCPECGTVPRN
jgi:hypothetical protein